MCMHVSESLPLCESSVGVSGIVVENDSHTVECLFTTHGNLKAQHKWNRPELSKSQNDSTDWSGIQFAVDPSVDNATMSVEITFDEDVFAAGEDSVRPWSHTYSTPQLEVNCKLESILNGNCDCFVSKQIKKINMDKGGDVSNKILSNTSNPVCQLSPNTRVWNAAKFGCEIIWHTWSNKRIFYSASTCTWWQWWCIRVKIRIDDGMDQYLFVTDNEHSQRRGNVFNSHKS